MADSKISALPAAGSLDGSEVLPLVQGGATKQATTQDIADLAGSGATPSGSAGAVQLSDGAGGLTSDAGLTYDAETDKLTAYHLTLNPGPDQNARLSLGTYVYGWIGGGGYGCGLGGVDNDSTRLWLSGNSYNINLARDIALGWNDSNVGLGTKDVGLARSAAGVLEINSGYSGGALRDLKARKTELTSDSTALTLSGVSAQIEHTGIGSFYLKSSGAVVAVNYANVLYLGGDSQVTGDWTLAVGQRFADADGKALKIVGGQAWDLATNRNGGPVYIDGGPSTGTGLPGDVYVGNTRGNLRVGGLTFLKPYTNATEPSWVNGASFFNTDLDKLRIGGASGWETVTSA